MDANKAIAILLPDMRGGGVERVRLLLMRELLNRGYSVELVLMQRNGELLAEVPEGVSIHVLGARRLRGVLFPLSQYLLRSRPLALLAAMWPLTAVAVVAARLTRYGGRVVVSEHVHFSSSPSMRGLSGGVQRLVGRSLYGGADAVVAVSEGIKADLQERIGLSARSIEVIYNAVRQGSDPRTPLRDDIVHWWRGAASKLIAVGSLKPQKDYTCLIRALDLVVKNRDARLLILGEGDLRQELTQMIHDHGLNDRVMLPGFVSDPLSYLAIADLFVLSSAWEGLPGVLIEALVMGTPVVSTDFPSGPAEILQNGKYGRLVPVGDLEALAKAIDEALDAEHDRAMLRARGAEFSVERTADQYLELLDPGGKLLAASR